MRAILSDVPSRRWQKHTRSSRGPRPKRIAPHCSSSSLERTISWRCAHGRSRPQALAASRSLHRGVVREFTPIAKTAIHAKMTQPTPAISGARIGALAAARPTIRSGRIGRIIMQPLIRTTDAQACRCRAVCVAPSVRNADAFKTTALVGVGILRPVRTAAADAAQRTSILESYARNSRRSLRDRC
jgi:hypothetical protein